MVQPDNDDAPNDKGLDNTQRLLEEMDETMQRVRLIIDRPSNTTPPAGNDGDKKDPSSARVV